jgi:thioesterase domain-containing protein
VTGVSWPYQILGSHLDSPIIGIQQTQRDDQIAPRSIREMAANYADTIQATHPTGPYRLLGWSFGGVLAHAVAVELQRRGGVVARLVLLDAEPGLNSMATQAVDRSQLDLVLGESAGHETLLDQMVHNFNANVGLYRDHEADVFHGDLVVFSAARDDRDRSSFLQRSWRPHASGDIIVHSTDCTHQAMLTTEALSLYGRHLSQVLGGETM